MRRLLVLIAAVLVVIVALGITLTSSSSSSAAVVNGQALSESQLTSDLAAVTGSPGYLCYLNAATLIRTGGQSELAPVHGSSKTALSSGFVASWLDQEITSMLVSQHAANLGIRAPTPQELALAKQDLISEMDATLDQVSATRFACSTNAERILAAMPSAFVARQVTAQALSEAVLSHEGKISLSAQSLRSYFTTHPSRFETVCVSGILLDSKSAATAVRAQLEAGANFAAMATEHSQDPSKSSGGSLGCFAPGSAQYQSVQTDVGSLGVGQVTQPLASENGDYVLLSVTKRSPSTYAAVASFVRHTVLSVDAATASGSANDLVKDATVTLNSKYGTWRRSGTNSGVVPPTTHRASRTS